MIGGLFTAGRLAWSAVTGVDALVDTLARMGVKLALRSRAIDRSVAEDIVERARGRVPRDTGRLYSGIAVTERDGVCGVIASAVHPDDPREMDYAFLVEHGTRPGVRGQRIADPDFYRTAAGGRGGINPATGRRFRVANANRRSQRTHPGTKPQPYFWPAVEEGLAARGIAMADVIADVAGEEGF
ncbi:HK97 gp10 family phage protein [Methylobacterium nodulans]|uniref:Phage protein, HK97 gp10 family n=1 Tax=Methylobacterium nodulans (strain LMG 21967 / CNCM I-2342 / ORS 2060) TaxID=460265 RepID=B8ILT6_METNO|nr:HK97 gp10 family phage protein [Methylobacterium nodulans]ACL62061.1 phage protein, HK97 gp10 family [Methylobacterium nodulans ORS 2060]